MATQVEIPGTVQAELDRARRTKKMLWLSLVVTIVLVVGLSIALLVGGSATSERIERDRLTRMETSGALQTMVEQHQTMMEQMRAGLSPEMQDRMDVDPMWKLMRNGEFTRMMEDQQEAIDRMLGR